MQGINFNNFDSVARNFDKNKNGVVEELKITDQVRSKIDTNKDLKIDTKELSSAMKSNTVEVKNDEITYSKGIRANNLQMEKLDKIHNATKSASQWMFPTDYSDTKGQEKIEKLTKNNAKFDKSIQEMEDTLINVASLTNNSDDKTTKFINTVARNALDDSSKLKQASIRNINASKDNSGKIVNDKPLEDANNELRTSYSILNSALEMITKETNNLPNLNKTSGELNKSLSKALKNINIIKNSSKSPDDVKKQLLALGLEKELHVKGRAKPYAGGGSSIGAITGGVAGFYFGRSFKAVSIGVATGASIGAAMGALSGKLVDQRFSNQASQLRRLANDVSTYNSESDEKALEELSGESYKTLIDIGDNIDLDTSKEADKTLKEIKESISQIESKTERIAKGYKKAE